jgi:hypothetical protein
MSKFILCAVGALSLTAILLADRAEAASNTDGTAPFSASVTLNHRITYPRFLRFQVGAAGAGISAINCDLSAQAANLGNGTNLNCTGGDLGGGVSTVLVQSNAGQIRLTATTLGALVSGANTLPYSEITTTTNDANLPSPVLPAAGGTSGSVNVAINAGSVTNRTANWTYQFDNSTVYRSGTYGGANVNNGRVTYTASSP